MILRECPVCQRMWDDVDNSGVCPNGHETLADDEDEYPVGQVTI